MLCNSRSVFLTNCTAVNILIVYASSPGGCGAGRGEPLAARSLNPGGCGAGSGEPLALRTLNPGGCGAGSGEPLALSSLNPGGCGAGSGEPLALRTLNPGGWGAGSGEPLRIAAEAEMSRLLDNCLTELLTGSTIKTATTSNARRTEVFFIMDEPLLAQP